MKHWLILPIFLIILSIIANLADCSESTGDLLFHEVDLRNKIDDVQNDMDLVTNLPILENTEDSDRNSMLDQRISLTFSKYLFNKTRQGIVTTVNSVEQATVLLISKIATLKDDFLEKLNETFKNIKEDVKETVESITDQSVNVVNCVLEQKSAFDSLVEESITGAMNCVKDTVAEGLKVINEAVNASTEAKALAEDISKQEAECENKSAESGGILKCLLGILRLTKASVKLVFVKIRTAVRVAFKTSNQVPQKLISCQSTIKNDTLKIIQNIKECAENPDALFERDSEIPEEEKSASDNYDEFEPPEPEEYDEEIDYHILKGKY